jgi:hypothetical protein
MRTPRLSRRTLLRGLLGGAAVGVALPPLEAFFDANGRAYAATGAFPQRFGLFFWGNGILPDRWLPAQSGADWALSDQLAPLNNLRDHFTLISGTEVKVTNVDAHISGPAGLLSGRNSVIRDSSYTFGGPTLDQVVGAALGSTTRFRTLEVGVQPGLVGLSFNGPDSRNPPETSAAALFERLFGPTFRLPGEEPIFDPTLALRRSVLDAVLADAAALDARLGAVDRARLDQHMTAVRELELRIARLEDDPPQLDACLRPAEPLAVPDVDGRVQMRERAAVISELVAMAYACDLTRSLSYWYSDPLSDVLYDGATAGHHQLTHDEPGDQPQVHEIMLEVMGAFADLLEALRRIPEGDGTVLDHCAILGTTDVSYGRTHQIDEFPMVLAGGACGRLKNGLHYRSVTKENAGKVPLSILRALGINAGSYGVDDALTTDGLSAIEV